MKNKLFWNELATFYKIFADCSRLQILNVLLSGKKNVTEICEALEMSQSAVSHQLKTLRDSTLVVGEKTGQSVYYKIADEHIRIILEYGSEHLQERKEQ